MQWKHKTKQNIIKKIKERNLLKSVPETYTIQNVLGFLQTIFLSKSEAKYFLTLIGDCILKKNTDNLLFFVSSNTKRLINLIDSITYITTGNSIMNNFVSKFHDSHNIKNYRLIKSNENTNEVSYDILKDVLNNIGIDLLCVATHYSDRYSNSDNYLNTKMDEINKKNILYFAFNSSEKIVDDFISNCIEVVSSESNINWKNMHYIWKTYLSNINIPNIIYSNNLQQLLSQKLANITENGNIIFTNITSKILPHVSSFLSFWDKYVTITETDVNEDHIDEEFEIDELATLYKYSDIKNIQINDTNMIQMICHYFSPKVEVIDNKYITNIKCSLWSKQYDINEYLEQYKSNFNLNTNSSININSDLNLLSFNELYQGYKSYYKTKSNLVVSKNFFEKYLLHSLEKYIKFDKFVSINWLTAS